MIDVIIPVYNCEKYISRCIESVIHQSYSSWKLYIVDDGSTDSSKHIAQKFAEKDKRINIIEKDNGGVSSARNIGLDYCSQEIVVFIDADDWIEENYFQLIVENWSDDIDVLLFDYFESYGLNEKKASFFFNENIRAKTNGMELKSICIETLLGKDIKKNCAANNTIAVPWAKAYRRTILEDYDIRFKPGIFLNEDLLFNIRVFTVDSEIKYVNNNVYDYFQNSVSISNSLEKKGCLAIIKNQVECQKYIEKILPLKYKSLLKYIYLKNVKLILWNACRADIRSKELEKYLVKTSEKMCFTKKELNMVDYVIYKCVKMQQYLLVYGLYRLLHKFRG